MFRASEQQAMIVYHSVFAGRFLWQKGRSSPFGTTRFTRGYIITPGRFTFTEPILSQIGSREGKFFFEWQTGVFINGSNDKHIAALKFGTPGDLSNPFYTWIRSDIDKATATCHRFSFRLADRCKEQMIRAINSLFKKMKMIHKSESFFVRNRKVSFGLHWLVTGIRTIRSLRKYYGKSVNALEFVYWILRRTC